MSNQIKGHIPAHTIGLIAVSIIATGCTTTPTDVALQAEDAHHAVIEKRNESIQEHIASLPEWIAKPPAADANGVFAVGIGESDDLSIAIKKAHIEAEFSLAQQFQQEISGDEKVWAKDEGENAATRYEALIDKLVAEIPLTGFQLADQQIRAGSGKYQAYVLLKLPYNTFNRMLQQQRDRDNRTEMREAWSDLEQRLEARRNARINAAPSPTRDSAIPTLEAPVN